MKAGLFQYLALKIYIYCTHIHILYTYITPLNQITHQINTSTIQIQISERAAPRHTGRATEGGPIPIPGAGDTPGRCQQQGPQVHQQVPALAQHFPPLQCAERGRCSTAPDTVSSFPIGLYIIFTTTIVHFQLIYTFFRWIQ